MKIGFSFCHLVSDVFVCVCVCGARRSIRLFNKILLGAPYSQVLADRRDFVGEVNYYVQVLENVLLRIEFPLKLNMAQRDNNCGCYICECTFGLI